MKRLLFMPLACVALLWSCNKNEVIGGGEGTDDAWEYDAVKVLEYTPAPGQFINEGYSVSTAAEAVRWAQGRIDKNEYVSLGAFGGYIVFQPSQRVTNGEGYDFGISGNPITSQNEPGIVWVSRDENGDGVPGVWYQLKGSEEGTAGYTATYYRTTEPGDIRWTDDRGGEGVVKHMSSFHSQNYYPVWCDTEGSFTLTGTLLQPKYSDSSAILSNAAYGWGYADNLGKDAAYDDKGKYLYNRFDISDAVDEDGKAVTLLSVDFVKVQSSLLFNMGTTGELSTEVTGFVILSK